MSDERLKPCPFCGGKAVLHIVEPHKHELATWMPDYGGGAFIECTQCTSGMSAESEAEVIEAWNTRKPMERIVERLEERASAHERIMLGCANVEERHLHCRISDEYKQAIEIVKGGGVDE